MDELVVLVDTQDQELGVAEKLAAHRQGVLHRAISVFLFDRVGRLLLQRRAADKYHGGGLWSNTCCGHPRPGEAPAQAATRRLAEEMGLECTLAPAGRVQYRAPVSAELTEHELDHVFVGRCDRDPAPEPREVSEWCWMGLPELRRQLRAAPERFTPWLPILLDRLPGLVGAAELENPGGVEEGA